MDAWFSWLFLPILLVSSIILVVVWASRHATVRRQVEAGNHKYVSSSSELAVSKVFAVGITSGLILLIISAFFMTSFTVVGVKTVAVTTQFGKIGNTWGSGWHWKAPTAKVSKWDGSLQTQVYSNSNEDDGDKITTRLANGGEGYVTAQIQWRVTDKNFGQLFNDYKELDNVTKKVVHPELKTALVDVFAPYSPINELKDGKVARSYSSFGESAKELLVSRLSKKGVKFESITITNLEFDKDTQRVLNDLQVSIGQTAKAKQDQLTNNERKLANENLGTTKVDPCNLIADLAAKGQLDKLPVNAIQCGTGAGVPVIVGQK